MMNKSSSIWKHFKRLLRIIEVAATIFAAGACLYYSNSFIIPINRIGNSAHSYITMYTANGTGSTINVLQPDQTQEIYESPESVGEFERGVGVVALVNGKTISMNEESCVKPGDVITAYAYSVFETAFIGYYFSINGENTPIKDNNDNRVNITIPSFPNGMHIKLYVEAVSINNTGSDDYYFRSGWIEYKLVMKCDGV